MMAYVQIPDFGRYPMYVGKEYLRGFGDGLSDTISYDMYLDAKKAFVEFWKMLDTAFEIPMMFIRSGLVIPINTKKYTNGIKNSEQAQQIIEKAWYDIDNQTNMDW